jgi:hypothetical protein
MGFAVSHARVRSSGGRQASGTTDHYYNEATVLPQHLEVRLAPVGWMDVGADVGWLDAGTDLRLGVPAEKGRIFAGHFAGGIRTGRLSIANATRDNGSYWGRFEAYPLVAGDTGRLLLSIGVSSGLFYHELELREPEDDDYEGVGLPNFHIVRKETRLETGIGYHFRVGRGVILFAANPYFILRSRAAPEPCTPCPWPEEWKQTWGLVFIVRAAARVPLAPGREP